MKKILPAILSVFLGLSCTGVALAQTSPFEPTKQSIPNRLIDYPGFAKAVNESGRLREQRRLTEAQYLKAMHEKGVVILDARTDKRYDMLHLHGAVNLPFTEFTVQTLAQVIPSKKTKVLIYCNNNFRGDVQAFADKSPGASLNLSTFAALVTYGYTNVYELGPLLDVNTTRLPFDGEHALIQKVVASSAATNWRVSLSNPAVQYKFVRSFYSNNSYFAVFQKITGAALPATHEVGPPSVGGFPRPADAILPSPEAFARYDGSGLLLEEADAPGKYVFGLTSKDLHDYLHPNQSAAR